MIAVTAILIVCMLPLNVSASDESPMWDEWRDAGLTPVEETEDRQVRQITEYRYRDMEYTYSGSPKLAGYTYVSNEVLGTEYGPWEQEEQFEEAHNAGEYRYDTTIETVPCYCLRTYTCACEKWFWKNAVGLCKYCNGLTTMELRMWTEKDVSETSYQLDTDGSYFLPTVLNYDMPEFGEVYRIAYRDGLPRIDEFSSKSTVGDRNTFMWPAGERTMYRKVTVKSRNLFKKIGDWSTWQEAEPAELEDREIESRVIYQYRDRFKPQTIECKSEFNKTTNSSSFNLNATAETTLSYSSNNTKVAAVGSDGQVTVKGPGTATITIKAAAENGYPAVIEKTKVNVKLATPTLTAKNVKRRQTLLKWTKSNYCTGYKVYVKVPGSSKYKLRTTKSYKVKGTYHSKLKKGKKYYYKVRAYAKVDGKTYYSAYSSVKKVKIRK